ncbi:MAG: hypothetical protein K2M59_03825 [Muribaculaceae bacterium]|nr:hypothetical protein [Muribaculaceae bacterium]MDE7465539.1 hypothetical protein [Muribaculaceae bacterium]
MTIRLTSVEAFEKVLEKLKQAPTYDEKANEPFIKYCVPNIKEEIAKGDDEWYLDVDWFPDSATCKVVMVLRYHKRSDIMTDEKYLTDKLNDK